MAACLTDLSDQDQEALRGGVVFAEVLASIVLQLESLKDQGYTRTDVHNAVIDTLKSKWQTRITGGV